MILRRRGESRRAFPGRSGAQSRVDHMPPKLKGGVGARRSGGVETRGPSGRQVAGEGTGREQPDQPGGQRGAIVGDDAVELALLPQMIHQPPGPPRPNWNAEPRSISSAEAASACGAAGRGFVYNAPSTISATRWDGASSTSWYVARGRASGSRLGVAVVIASCLPVGPVYTQCLGRPESAR